MIRTLFAGLGVIFALLIVFWASFLGRLAYELDAQRPEHQRLAVDITRELARTWSVKDVRKHYAASMSKRIDAAGAQQPFNALKPLGPLRYVEDVEVHTGWTRDNLHRVTSPAAAAELLAELLSKTVRVSFLAKFANGFARVTVELRNDGGAMKLWHLQIDSQEALRQAPSPRPQAISHA
jgi:hypothetical protein